MNKTLAPALVCSLSLAACGGAPETPPVTPPAPTASAAASAVATAAPSASAVATAVPVATSAPAAAPAFTALPLPGAPANGVFMDYLACDRAAGRVWVPAGNTGSVDVIATAGDHAITRVEGFATKEVERNGKKRVVGPSGATIGDGVAYVGNRGDSTVCAVDGKTLKKAGCVTLPSSPDGVAYVASAKEVWVTTPRDKTIVVLDVKTPAAPKIATKIVLEGEPEGYAVDDGKGLFYTNLEDKDKSLVIDVKTHKVKSTWEPRCGEDGPKGLAIDRERSFLMVACTDHLIVLDAGHDGKLLGQLPTGPGVDNIDYLEPQHLLYAGAGKAATLTIGRLEAAGTLTSVAVIPTVAGARNAVVDNGGNAYLTDSAGGRILFVPARP